MRPIRTVSLIGLGKLGLPMAVAYAKRGFHVVGTDLNPRIRREVARGVSPLREAQVPALLRRFHGRILVAPSITEAVAASDATFVIVPTPSKRDGAFSNQHLLAALREVAVALRRKRAYHLIVVTCTVMPGTLDQIVRPLIERLSGRRCGRDFGLAYNPEFIALGNVVHDLLNPDFVLVGESDKRSGHLLERFYRETCENGAPVARMTTIEAEIAKIALNCYCTTKIAFANMLAEIAERIPGADAAVIANALGMDSRIGRKYLSPGLGFGGPCFPRDNVAFRRFARALEVSAPLPESVHRTNRRQAARVVARARALLPRGGRVAVLGLSYKPETPVVTASQAMEIVETLAGDRRFKIRAFDAMAGAQAAPRLDRRVRIENTMEAALHGADLCIMATAWKGFGHLTNSVLSRHMRHTRVIDCWRCIPRGEARRFKQYAAIGLGPALNCRTEPCRTR